MLPDPFVSLGTRVITLREVIAADGDIVWPIGAFGMIDKLPAGALHPYPYVLEQLYSPLVVHETEMFHELRQIANGCITRHHAHHYMGFSRTERRLYEKEAVKRVKPLLYVFRVLLTGIHLMRTGRIEANLSVLNGEFELAYLPDLIARKVEGKEKETMPDTEFAFFQSEYHRLYAQLEAESEASKLPDATNAKDALNDLLIRVRKHYG